MSKIKDLTGKRFGRLLVVERAGSRNGQAAWLCKCDCGNIKVVVGASLRFGVTQSCGCLSREKKPDGANRDRIYRVYHGIKHRCYNPNSNAYKNYGGRGITMCDEWLKDFETFKKWMLEHGYDYSKSQTEQQIDRIDNNKGYSPDNCRIVTIKENARNTSQNVHITYNGETLTPGEWSEKLGIPASRIYRRMELTNDPEKILSLETRSGMSNTGVKGISYIKSKKEYVVHIGKKYIGASQTLEGAIKIKEEYENGK